MMKNARGFDDFCGCTGIGIDVSKATLEVVGLSGTQVWQKSLANNRPAIESLAKTLSEGGYTGKIVCESTGHYHLLLGLIFAEYELDLRIINPLQSSKHQKSRVRKTKTDRVDGYVLATMCETERELPKAANLQSKSVLIRLKQGQLHALDKQLQKLQRSVRAYRETYTRLSLVPGDSLERIEQLARELKSVKRQLTTELEGLLTAEADRQQDIERLRQLPGFSALVAGLVSHVFDRQAKSHKSWAAYAGLDVSVRQSGTWRGRGKLTKRGNSYLRKRLYCAAWGAVMNYAEVRACYDALKTSGRNHVEALCIIARKLLRIAYTVLVKGKDYDPKIAFAR
jgi:transposase